MSRYLAVDRVTDPTNTATPKHPHQLDASQGCALTTTHLAREFVPCDVRVSRSALATLAAVTSVHTAHLRPGFSVVHSFWAMTAQTTSLDPDFD